MNENVQNAYENALIGLTVMQNILGKKATVEDRALIAKEFTPYELFAYTSATLAMVLTIEANNNDVTLEEYIAQLRLDFTSFDGA